MRGKVSRNSSPGRWRTGARGYRLVGQAGAGPWLAMAVDGQPRTRTPSMDLKLLLPDVVLRLKRAYWRGRTLAAGLWRADAVRMAERRRGPVRPGDGGSGTAVITQTRTRTKRPHLY